MINKYYTADIIDLDNNNVIIGNIIVRVFIWQSAYFTYSKMRDAINDGCNGRNLQLTQFRRVS